MRLVRDFRDRRIIQIMASYAAVAWIGLEVVDQLVDRGVLPEIVYLLVLVWFIGGLGAAAVTGWHHGEKGDQAVTRTEVALLGVILLATVLGSVKTVVDYRERQAVAGVLDAATGLDARRLAVLYFQERGAQDGDMAFLADALTEDLIGELSAVRGIEVVSRNGTGQYRDSGLPPDSIARLLDAGTFVEGSVESRGENVRVEVALRDAESGATIERGSFDLPAADAAALRSGLEDEVSRFLRTWLGEEIRLRAGRSGDVGDAAWILVQRAERAIKDGKALFEDDDDGADAQFDRADDMLAQAQELEPGWAEPLVRRGRLAYERARMEGDVLDADDRMTVAVGFLNQGLEIEPRNADALEVRGMVRYWRWLMALEPDHDAAERLLDDAEKDLRTATEVNPLQANAWNVLGHLYYQLDDIVQANMAARQAYDADAFLTSAPDILWRLWSTSYDLENKTQSRQWCEEGLRRFPENPRFYQCQLWNMTSGAAEADPDRAWTLLQDVLDRTPEHERELTRLQMQVLVAGAMANVRSGPLLADSARSVLARSRGDARVDPTRELLMTQAFVHTLLGDKQEAVDLLQQYLTFNPERRQGFAEHGHWWWRELRSDAAYQRMIGG